MAAVEEEFPTASTVPFPYKTPYNVQRELMSAILSALQQCDNDDDATTCVDGAPSKLSNIKDDDSNKKRRRRAPIIMVESPTGTGKSLSLACASLSWLKYREGADIDKLLTSAIDNQDEEDDSKVKATVSPSPTSSNSSNNNKKSKVKKYDWIEAWQPTNIDADTPKERCTDEQVKNAPPPTTSEESPTTNNGTASPSKQPQQQVVVLKKEEQITNYAIQNRNALNVELSNIRSRLDRLVTIATFPNDTNGSGNNDTNGSNKKKVREQKIRNIRENLVKGSVSSAIAKERKKSRQLAKQVGGKRRKTAVSSASSSRVENEFLVDAYHSDDEAHRNSCSNRGDISSDSEEETSLTDLAKKKKEQQSKKGGEQIQLSNKALLEGSNLDGSGYDNDPEYIATRRVIKSGSNNNQQATAVGGVTPNTGLRKIIYAARTHSQLSQFISELKRTHWGKHVKVVALGSRSLLCSNDSVLYSSKTNKKSSRRSEAEITELCLDMQKSKSNGTKRINNGDEKKKANQKQPTSCPYKASSDAISTLALHSLVRPSDIEDMANLGKASHTCSYYASRTALSAAEVVVLPYNTLLSKQARQSIGLSIKNSLIIIDEAHNIPETLRSISSCTLSLVVLEAALSQLLAYIRKYTDRLAGRNIFYLGQIRRILVSMIKYIKKRPTSSQQQQQQGTTRKEMMAAVALMFTLKLDNINLFSIVRYLEKSRLSQKLLGFVNHTAATAAEGEDTANTEPKKKEFMSKHISSMSIFETFIQRLTGTSREGKIIVEWPSSTEGEDSIKQSPTFRFVQIRSASQLDNVVEEAHAIVLAGGTLRPFTHVAAELFGDDIDVMSAASTAEGQLARNYDQLPNKSSSIPSSLVQVTPSLTTFTCGHVIPQSNILMACLSSGPTSHKLDFRHTSRSTTEMIDELGRSVLNLCSIVPKGFVVFLPSYNYESQVFQRWRATGLLSQMNKKKSVHREPKNSRDLEASLAKYSSEASTTKDGALLFSVMGGKMSEGINFADDMARCVLVAGLPYPDITDPVLKEKMQSLDKEYRNTGGSIGITGQAYYQNLCMRTVNQSVGRAIRHANDYAVIVLADYRYSSDSRIWSGLPQWLKRGGSVPRQSNAVFGKVTEDITSFFVTNER